MSTKPVGLFDIDITSYRGMLMRDILLNQAVDGILSESVFDPMLELEIQYDNGKGPLRYEDFAARILEYWAKGLEGQTLDDVTSHAGEFLEGQKDEFYPYVGEVIQDTRDTHNIFFITAEPAFVASIVTEMFGATGYFASEFEVEDGCFTGKVKVALATEEEKVEALRELTFSTEGSYAFGDTKADAGVLSLVETPICMNPDAELRVIAAQSGWMIVSPEGARQTISEISLRNIRGVGKER